jgi:hypothetical protein
MVDHDVVKCPLCNGFTHSENSDLRQAAITARGDRKIRCSVPSDHNHIFG